MTTNQTAKSAGDSARDVASPELDELLCFDLYAASRAVTAAYRPILAPHGLTYPQYLVLVLLWGRDGRTIRDLADTLRLDHGTLTPLLRRMEDAGLVSRTRDTADERVVVVRLAPRGEELRSAADDVQCRIAVALGVTADEAQALAQQLRALTSHLALSSRDTRDTLDDAR
jgi:DNA-binding MarR family transcriptional regulator